MRKVSHEREWFVVSSSMNLINPNICKIMCLLVVKLINHQQFINHFLTAFINAKRVKARRSAYMQFKWMSLFYTRTVYVWRIFYFGKTHKLCSINLSTSLFTLPFIFHFLLLLFACAVFLSCYSCTTINLSWYAIYLYIFKAKKREPKRMSNKEWELSVIKLTIRVCFVQRMTQDSEIQYWWWWAKWLADRLT